MVFGNETEAAAFAEANKMPADSTVEEIALAIADLPSVKGTDRIVIITQVS